jgi:hypothetical protein
MAASISALAIDAEADACSAALDVGIANAMSFLLKVPLCGCIGSLPTLTTGQTAFFFGLTLFNDPLASCLAKSSKKCKIYVEPANSPHHTSEHAQKKSDFRQGLGLTLVVFMKGSVREQRTTEPMVRLKTVKLLYLNIHSYPARQVLYNAQCQPPIQRLRAPFKMSSECVGL